MRRAPTPTTAIAGIACTSLLLVAGAAFASAAEDLAEAAENAYVELDYAGCIKSADASVQRPGEADDRVRAYKFRGLCFAALSDVDEARASFESMLAIDLEARLPAGLSPRFTSSYFEAKGRWIGRESIALKIQKDEEDDDIRVLRISLKDEAELISHIGWRDEAGKLFGKVKSATRLELEVDSETAKDIVALDKGGAILRVTKLPELDPPEDEVTPSALRPVRPVAPEPEEAMDPTVLIIGGTAAGLIVAAVVVSGAVGGLYYLNQQFVDVEGSVSFNE